MQRGHDGERLEDLAQLAGSIAHDLNNLLGVIMNYAALVGDELDLAPIKDYVGQIRLAAERVASLTQQLMTAAELAVVDESVEPTDV